MLVELCLSTDRQPLGFRPLLSASFPRILVSRQRRWVRSLTFCALIRTAQWDWLCQQGPRQQATQG